ncbi:hypothetical protein EC991_009059 [Linnemannia zychae]|nr:hypothetical protein EC991_009059 [Linnemannia zychae]
MRQSNCRHGAADGPTLKAIKRVWRNLVKTPSVDDDSNIDFLGYAPLPSLSMVHQDEVSAEEGLCVNRGEVNNEKGMHQVDFSKIHSCDNRRRRHQPEQVSALPRPKTILLASLWVWTLLMTLSAKMGLNSLEQISVPPSFAVSSLSPMTRLDPVPTHMIQGGSSVSGAPIFILPPLMPFPADLQPLETQEEDAEIDLRSWEPTSDLWSAEQQQQQRQQGESATDSVVALLDMDMNIQFNAIEALWAEDQPTTAENEDEQAQPFARIQTSIVIINGNNMDNDASDPTESSSLEDAEIEADIEDMSSLDAMIMDPQDEAVFHDFLQQLDQEDEALEQAQDQQRRKLFKATDDLMVSSMLENDLPCGYYSRRNSGAGLFSDNKWLASLQQFLVGDSVSAADAAPYPGRTFVYTGWSTDLMIVAVAMCLGGVLVGLAQSKILYHQFLDQHVTSSLSATANVSLRRRTSWTTILASFSLCTSALALTFLMIADESWDVPAIYFVGIGIAGIILVHAWVPNVALSIHSHRDTTDNSSTDDEDDEDTCIGSDEDEGSKLFSPIPSPSTEEHPFVWSPPMAERRNACSLDENHRWEVVSAAATSQETTCYTR